MDSTAAEVADPPPGAHPSRGAPAAHPRSERRLPGGHRGPHSPAAAAGPTTTDPVQAGVRRVAGVAVEPAVVLVGQAPQPHSGTGRSGTAPHTSRGSTRIAATVHSSESEPHEGPRATFAADGHGSAADD